MSYHLTPNSRLPLPVQQNIEAVIFVGDGVQTDKPEEVILFVRTNTADSMTVSMNNQLLHTADTSYPGLFDKLRGIKNGQKVSAFTVLVQHLKKGDNTLRFSSPNGVVVQRIELALKYGPVETNGFF